jgi:putative oxidoreductase
VLLALGLVTSFAAAALIAVMVAAIISVHFVKGLWSTNGGYEYNLVLSSVVFALAAIGAGNWSLDHALSLSDHGVLWAIGALVVGIVGGAGAVLIGRTQRRASAQPATSRPTTA